MPSEIKGKFGTSSVLTVTLASLASSTSGVGRQSDLVDNSTARYQKLHLFFKITTGTSPTAGKGIYAYFLKADKTSSANVITDGAGLTDAALTVVAAIPIASTLVSGSSNITYQFDAVVYDPGPMWGVAIVQDTGANLNSTSGNHCIYYVGDNPEAQ